MKALKTIRLFLGVNEATGGALEKQYYEGQEVDRADIEKYKVQLEANGVIRSVEGKNNRPKESQTRGK